MASPEAAMALASPVGFLVVDLFHGLFDPAASVFSRWIWGWEAVGEVTFAVEPLVGAVPFVEGSAVVEALGEVVAEDMDEGNLRSVGLSTMGFITTVPFSAVVDVESGGAVAERAWLVVVISIGALFLIDWLEDCLRTWCATGESVLDMVVVGFLIVDVASCP